MAIDKLTTLSLGTGVITADLIATGAITVSDITDGEITAAKLHTTLDLATKTLTLPQASVTAHQASLSVTQSQISDLSSTSDLTEGTNLYYTDSRADARITAATTTDLTEGTNLYYTDVRADARITAATTTDLSEGTNLYYTDARADARAALLVDSAPATLDTLNELAAALGDDPNFATTVTNSIATKLPLAGGTLTGDLNVGGEINLTASGNNYVDYTDILHIRAAGSSPTYESSITMHKDGAVALSHNGTIKLETTAAGISVAGTASIDGATQLGTKLTTVVTNLLATNWYRVATLTSQNQPKVLNLQIGNNNNHQNTIVNLYKGTGYYTAEVFEGGRYTYADDITRVRIVDEGVNQPVHVDIQTGATDASSTYTVLADYRSTHYGGLSLLAFTDQGTTAVGDIYPVSNVISSVGSGVSDGPVFTVKEDKTATFTGNVGIGTSSPSYPLHISGTGHQRLLIEKTDAGGDADISIAGPSDSIGWVLFKDSTQGNNSGVIKYVHSTNKMHFRTNDVDDRLVISSDGNVGIGTSTPEVKLEVNGGADGSVVFGGRSDGGNGNNRRFNLIAYANGGGANYGGGLKIQTRSATNVFDDAITVQSNGNVGIGTTTPSDKLTVTGGHINLPTVNSYIKGNGHNVLQVDATRTYFYGGTNGMQFRTSDNSAELVNILDNGIVQIKNNQLQLATLASDPAGVDGGVYYNTTSKTMRIFSDSAWGDVYEAPFSGAGGTTYTSGGYKYHKFTSSGTFAVTSTGTVEVLMVAGGGGAGRDDYAGGRGAGGGGAGGLIAPQTINNLSSNLTIVVGGGGTNSGGNGAAGTQGGNTTVTGLTTAIGGGGGGSHSTSTNIDNDTSGGSGGGASNGRTGSAGTSGQGNSGGNGAPDGPYGGGGGGGKNQSGASSNNGAANGGNGTNSYNVWASATSSGDSGHFAGGGAGGGKNAGGGAGGAGGGGDANNGPGQVNTGGGGGGNHASTAGSGGSGIVIIRYAV
tara:strand:+ start:47 stop:3007 length:2961 start_codon:yes stop_codon:yes gene_type:complete